ncbi:MAG: CocE/NonD family hydrolase [Verrucomicrobia bacterium]|nr:MAG: CocE/NonD family hydrolase [Verrucomicrobiota bacterium]
MVAMKIPTALRLAAALMVLVCGLVMEACGVHADDSVNAKLLALFPQFDADHNGKLSSDEQAKTLAFVRKQYGAVWAQRVQALFKAAADDGSVLQARWQEKARRYGQVSQETFRVAMRDGARLATDVYLPDDKGPFPVILVRTPYSRIQMAKGPAENMVNNGFAYVIQDSRGRFDSEGENLPFVGCGWGEHQDGVDTLAWIQQQPWCNGKIGTEGGSAMGITQNLLAGAGAGTNGLTVQHVNVAAESLFEVSYIGGAFRKADVENWMTGNKFDAKSLLLTHQHPTYDDYWRTMDTSLKYSVMNIPAMHVGGWFDMFAQATLNEFIGRQHNGAPGGRGKQKLVMGPWDHGGAKKEDVGELRFPNHQPPPGYGAGAWFAHYLCGEANGIEQRPAVAYYVMGDTTARHAPGNEWRFANDWPIPAAATPLYFVQGGLLDTTKPQAAAAHVEYTFQPTNPCPTIGGQNLTIARGPMNQNKIEQRSDVVLFTSAPLTAPVEVTGRITAKIFLSSSAADTDLSVRLCDVYPDGKSYLLTEGILRARYRKSVEQTAPLTPGQVEEFSVDCWSTSIVFNKGHRIRTTVTSSNYPRFDVNPGTGQSWRDDGAKVPQTNRIYCDAAHPSRLILPIVAPRTAARAVSSHELLMVAFISGNPKMMDNIQDFSLAISPADDMRRGFRREAVEHPQAGLP